MSIGISAINGIPPNESPQPPAKTSQVTGKSAKEQAESKAISETESNAWTTFEATAYIALCSEGCTGFTFTELDVRNTITYEGRRVVAVDPRVIPLHTPLTIRLADGTEIAAIAEDTGGLIKGRKLDVLVATEKEARQFGRQKVRVKIEN
ncbi:3D domain-containing protein [Paenibacillus sp. ACRRY]|uniref:3D domain-containing protein n=1 Tax=Paenibacillus sp. ACRRY TaxID=2918208 RepID=UPI001EF52440|nr:3D domain-containing protein [Paenibacillus sp. ACRRY]MCG7383375.1 3D domain-containing protein [Paenibacillus sp. ACRRY]